MKNKKFKKIKNSPPKRIKGEAASGRQINIDTKGLRVLDRGRRPCYHALMGGARRVKIDKSEVYARERLKNSPLKLDKKDVTAKAELNATSISTTNTCGDKIERPGDKRTEQP